MVPLSMLYSNVPTRIRRPVGLTDEDITAVVDYALAQVGGTSDLENILDLVRYLVSSSPAPGHLKRNCRRG